MSARNLSRVRDAMPRTGPSEYTHLTDFYPSSGATSEGPTSASEKKKKPPADVEPGAAHFDQRSHAETPPTVQQGGGFC